MMRLACLAFVTLLVTPALAARPAEDARTAKRASIVRGIATYREGGIELLPFKPTTAETQLFHATRASGERASWVAQRAALTARLTPATPARRGLGRLRRAAAPVTTTESPSAVRRSLVEGMAKYDIGGIGAILAAFDEITPADHAAFRETRAHYGIPLDE